MEAVEKQKPKQQPRKVYFTRVELERIWAVLGGSEAAIRRVTQSDMQELDSSIVEKIRAQLAMRYPNNPAYAPKPVAE